MERRARRIWAREKSAWARRRHPPLPYGDWAIPPAIVMCESGGQNLPPNSSDASGFYQILGSTWRSYGGSGSEAYLTPKSEQDRIAARIWREGGPSQWVCRG